jgi:UDP-N-acetylmuramoylalanine--D-glutamate ligase
VSFGIGSFLDGEGTFVKDGAIWWTGEGGTHALAPLDAVELRGEHNLQNALAASAVAAAVGFPAASVLSGLRGYRGEPHRLQFVGRALGADWYDDSIATAPERTLAALRSFEGPIVLLVGGRDKDLRWEELAQVVARRVDHLILFGEVAPVMESALRLMQRAPGGSSQPGPTVESYPGLDLAVAAAARQARAGDVVLLSPGGTSFDEFADFAARGDRFQELVRAL